MRKTKKTLAVLAIVAMVVAMIPVQAFADTSSAVPARLSGTTQYDTAVAIADQQYPNGSDNVVLAPGEKANLVDALAAGPLAAALNAPILLTDGKTLTADTLAILAKAKKVYVVSGNKVITDSVRSQLSNIVDVWGAEAPDTSVKIAQTIASINPFTKVVLANAGGQDALSVASFAAASNMPILVTNSKDGLPDSVKNYLAGLSGVTASYVIGGTAVISDAEKAQLPGATRLWGNTAYDTNLEVIKALGTSFNNVFIANGETMVDALAGAPLAASLKAPIVLTDGTNTAAASYVNGKMSSGSVVTALGGDKVVPPTVASGVVYTAPAAPEALAVKSVSALNAKQLEVVFTQPVDLTTAQTVGNYNIYKSDNTAVALIASGAKLASDKVTVTLTLANGITSATTYSISISGISADGNLASVIPTYFDTFAIAKDVTAPTIKSISSKTNGSTASQVDVTFTEPILAATFKIDGAYYGPTWNSTNTKASLKNLSIDSAASHTLEVINATDFNSNVTADVSQSFTVTKDTTAPTATLSAISDNQIRVTFNKEMDNTTINTSNITAADGALAAMAGATIANDANDTTGDTVYIISLNNSNLYLNSTTAQVNIGFSTSVKDSLGNSMSASTQTITLTKDAVAPVITGVSYKKNSNGYITDIILNSSKALRNATVTSTGVSVVGPDGKTSTASFNFPANSLTVPVGGTQVDYVLAPAMTTKINGQYVFSFPAGLLTDTSASANTSVATTLTVDFGSASGTFSFSGTITPNWAANVNSIAVNYGTTVKGGAVAGSATTLSNYTINGTALSAGSAVLNTNGDTVTITLPAGSVATTGNVTFGINNVQTSDARTIVSYTANVLLHDDTKPILSSAKYNNNDSITVNMDTLDSVVTAGTATNIKIVNSSGDLVAAGAATGVAIAVNSSNRSQSQATISFTGGTVSNQDLTGASLVIPAGAITDDEGNGNDAITLPLTDGYVAAVNGTTALTMADADATTTGVTGYDFRITGTNVAEPNVTYSVFVVTNSSGIVITKYNYTNYTAVATYSSNATATNYGNFGANVTLAGTVTKDSLGNNLAAVQYKIYIVSKDKAGNLNVSAAGTLTPVSEP